MNGLLLLTGGDDQQICLSSIIFRIEQPQTTFEANKTICHVQRMHQLQAHSSAIRGLWFNGRVAISVGLDQRLILWDIDHDGILTESFYEICEVPEPNALDVILLNGVYRIAVVGRGIQTFHLKQGLDL